jgi:hypothetical protein
MNHKNGVISCTSGFRPGIGVRHAEPAPRHETAFESHFNLSYDC